ncbi:hypothetical protein CES85_1927 [Ochrobactrum quorumnocens]|uniref:Uncharacterized protein n=1 Tax=Ochrobactrum quorumnocens TaxID=271865 RepID=A0A248UKV4_9HYPH|nr:hypothetical protein CES85_1927 [[Ochrobactrum] quorumnocens]
MGKNTMSTRHSRNTAIRAERFVQYRKLQLGGPSALSFGSR